MYVRACTIVCKISKRSALPFSFSLINWLKFCMKVSLRVFGCVDVYSCNWKASLWLSTYRIASVQAESFCFLPTLTQFSVGIYHYQCFNRFVCTCCFLPLSTSVCTNVYMNVNVCLNGRMCVLRGGFKIKRNPFFANFFLKHGLSNFIWTFCVL